MIDTLPDYRYRQLTEALESYGFVLDAAHYSLKEYTTVTPDKFFYLFVDNTYPNEVLALLVEDYVSGLAYLKECFSEELGATLVKLHTTIHSADGSDVMSLEASGMGSLQDGWQKLEPYEVSFPPHYSGYLATIIPNNHEEFWQRLHDGLPWL